MKSDRYRPDKDKKYKSGKKIPYGGSPEKDSRMITRVKALAEPLCASEGTELVQVEYQREAGGRVLRLYIDRPGGVNLDDCASISRQIGDLLDVELEQKATYHLEVSSPGPNRPLGKKADYDKFKGNKVKISISEPLDGKKQFQGILGGMKDGKVSLLKGENTMEIPYEKIIRARLVNYKGENKC
ncbi:MAG: ribosome maturation factor RimP [Desulfococcaceae bacterium]|jgi:ribosome maturation factor RimP|nr:ribosome maturation factor RimP [Desulfococcaceae bacterium]